MGVHAGLRELDGIPVHASRFLMTTLLREEIGFESISVSDFGAITMLHHSHRTAETPLEAGRQALWAGLDMEAPNVFGFGGELLEAVRRGAVRLAWVDQAVARVLRVKFMLGLFETPYLDAGLVRSESARRDRAGAARRPGKRGAAQERGQPVPLRPAEAAWPRGPNAAIAQAGRYTSPSAGPASAEAGPRSALGPIGSRIPRRIDRLRLRRQIDAPFAAAGRPMRCRVLGDNSCFSSGSAGGQGRRWQEHRHLRRRASTWPELKIPAAQQICSSRAATGNPSSSS